MGVFLKKVALLAMGCFASAAGTDLSGASSCLEMAHNDDVPEPMNVQLLQADLSVRRAKAATDGSEQDGLAVDGSAAPDVDAQAVQLKDHVSSLDAKVAHPTDKVDRFEAEEPALSAGGVQDASIAFHVKKAVRLVAFRSVTAIDVFHLLEQFPEGTGHEAGYPASEIHISNTSTTFDFARWLRATTCMLLYSLLLAAVYRHFKTPVVWSGWSVTGQSAEPTGQWSHGLCSCFGAPDVCFCAFCCPAIRWSETMSYVPALACCGVAGFWGWLLGFLLLVAVFFPFVLVMLVERRIAMRQQFKIKGSCPMDCLFYFCCMPCAMTQEGREVEDAVRIGSKCLVGEPVAV